MSLWHPDNVKDVAESVGIGNLHDDVAENLARDVEYRIAQVLEQALKLMRHAKRTTMTTGDVALALRLLDVEPLYGYEAARPLRFGEATMGPGQPLYYVEDEEVDFEKLINAPLPRIPREMSFTAHWLAVEGVQPAIPQNPTGGEARGGEASVGGKGVGAPANATLAAMSGNENVSVKPLVKHILSKELQLYFEKVCAAFLDEANDEYRSAAFASLRQDPGLHQLVPYFVQFISEKVTHCLGNLFALGQVMHMTEALIQNRSLYVDPYVPSLIPPVLTCLIGSNLGPSATTNPSTSSTIHPDPLAHFALRDLAAALISVIAKKYAHSSHTLRPRLARTFLKALLDPGRPIGAHYGAVIGLAAVGGPDVVRELVLPNLPAYDGLLVEALGGNGGNGGGDAEDQSAAGGNNNSNNNNNNNSSSSSSSNNVRRREAERMVATLCAVLGALVDRRRIGGRDEGAMTNGVGEDVRGRLAERVGGVVAARAVETGDWDVVAGVLGER